MYRFEDGDHDSTTLMDTNSRKMQRFRYSTDNAERRKSRRFSTGTVTSPSTNLKIPVDDSSNFRNFISSPLSNNIDEDSSSSTNSTEFNGVIFVEKKRKLIIFLNSILCNLIVWY